MTKKTDRPPRGTPEYDAWRKARRAQAIKDYLGDGPWMNEPNGPISGSMETTEEADREDRMETPPANNDSQ